MKKVKGSKGITLIALVITVIVLLILAGVSIATLTGDNGILTRAQEAKNKTEEAQKDQSIRTSHHVVEMLAMRDMTNKEERALLSLAKLS